MKAVGNQSYNRLVERVLSHPEAMAALQTFSGSASFSRRGDPSDSASNPGPAASADATASAPASTDPAAPGESLAPAPEVPQQAGAQATQPADALRAPTAEHPGQPGTESGGLGAEAAGMQATPTPSETVPAAVGNGSTGLETQLGGLGLGEAATRAAIDGAEAVAGLPATGTGSPSEHQAEAGGAAPDSADSASTHEGSHAEGKAESTSKVDPMAVGGTAGSDESVPMEGTGPDPVTEAVDGARQRPSSIKEAGPELRDAGVSSSGAEGEGAAVPGGEASDEPLPSDTSREAGTSASGDNEGVREALLISSFLTETASQLTYHGYVSPLQSAQPRASSCRRPLSIRGPQACFISRLLLLATATHFLSFLGYLCFLTAGSSACRRTSRTRSSASSSATITSARCSRCAASRTLAQSVAVHVRCPLQYLHYSSPK